MPFNDKTVSVAILHTHNMQTVKLVYWFSDRLYGLIIACGPTGTADHIITLRIQSHQLSRFYFFFFFFKVKSSEGRVFQLNWFNRSCINISIEQRTSLIIMFPVKYEFVKYGRVQGTECNMFLRVVVNLCCEL